MEEEEEGDSEGCWVEDDEPEQGGGASYQPRPNPSPLTDLVASSRRRASNAWLMME